MKLLRHEQELYFIISTLYINDIEWARWLGKSGDVQAQ